jgi:hypothetical protein
MSEMKLELVLKGGDWAKINPGKGRGCWGKRPQLRMSPICLGCTKKHRRACRERPWGIMMT